MYIIECNIVPKERCHCHANLDHVLEYVNYCQSKGQGLWLQWLPPQGLHNLSDLPLESISLSVQIILRFLYQILITAFTQFGDKYFFGPAFFEQLPNQMSLVIYIWTSVLTSHTPQKYIAAMQKACSKLVYSLQNWRQFFQTTKNHIQSLLKIVWEMN